MVATEFPGATSYIGENVGHVDALFHSDGPSAVEIRHFLRDVYGATP